MKYTITTKSDCYINYEVYAETEEQALDMFNHGAQYGKGNITDYANEVIYEVNEEVRDELEELALKEVCSCWYYDMCDAIDILSDEELQKIIDIPLYSHLHNQINNPVDTDEFMEEINDCYKVNYKKGAIS